MSLESVVAVLDEHGPSTRHEIAERLSVTPETVHAQLKRLVTHGRVSRYEHPIRRRGQPVFIYELPQQRPRPVGDRWLAARRAGTVPPLDRDRAACADMAPEMFFDRGPELAVQICADCPVDVGCLDFAIRTGTEHGVFGGCTPDERHRLAEAVSGR